MLNSQQINTWTRVQQQVTAAGNTMRLMGRSIGSLQERVNALRAQREWIPASNRRAIRSTNHEIRDLEREIERLNNLNGGKLSSWFNSLKAQIPMLNALSNPLLAIGASIYGLTGYLRESTKLYEAQAVAEQKLAAVMRNTMDAAQDEVNEILKLTSAQQKIGVIGDEVQLSGAQE
jgi:hypothetical protein